MKISKTRSLFAAVCSAFLLSVSARGDATYHPLSGGEFSQNWSNTGLITTNDTWTGVPSIIGYLGQDITALTGVDPQTLLTVSAAANDPDAIANQTTPNTATAGGVAEFQITDPTIALQGSGTADAPYIVIHLNTTGVSSVVVSYTLRDIDGSTDNAVQPVALQYRVGTTGNFINLPAGFVADASSGPSLATLTTNVAVTLPVDAENQAQVQVRIITANAAGSDEWIGIDDIRVTSGTVLSNPPAISASVPAANAANVPLNSAITLTFNQAVTTTGAWFAVSASASGAISATATGGPTTFTLTPATAFANAETITVTVFAAQVVDAATGLLHPAADATLAFTTAPVAGQSVAINAVQGSGAASPIVGQTVTIDGVVTGFYLNATGGRDGFYLQEPDASADADPLTSEGIYVFAGTSPSWAPAIAGLAVGDTVSVAGTVAEFANLTELTTLTDVTKIASGAPLPTAIAVNLPFAATTDLERTEGMRVTLPQTLTVTDNFTLGRYGQVSVSSGGLLLQPTNIVAPGSAALAQQAINDRNRLTIDDGSSKENPDVTPYLFGGATAAENTLRGGDTVTGATGVITYIAGLYMLEPTVAPAFVRANSRTAPPAVGGTLRVVGANVLNFFNGNGVGGGYPTSRGANSVAEFTRQRAHIVTSLVQIGADIYGLTEVENDRITNGAPNSYGATSAIADLVNGLNAAAPAGTTYAYIDASAVDIVSDEIHCAFIYRVETVALVGGPAMLSDPSFNNIARNPLAQTFRQISTGEKLTVSINHFKSKGSAASYPTSALNADQGDGQGNSNYVRKLQSQALTAWLATFPTGDTDPDILIIGDLNAYAKEDPITAIESAGYLNLTAAFEGATGYSYSFGGMWGHLDHALGTPSLSTQVTGAESWHNNSPEPIILDYNFEFKSVAAQAINDGNTPWRASDHDPIVIGLNLRRPTQTFTAYAAAANLAGASAAPDFDADNDGLSNLLEYVLGRRADFAESVPAPQATQENGLLIFRFTRARSVTGVNLEFFGSIDLVEWTPLGLAPVVESTTDTTETLKLVIETAEPRFFVRMQATLP